MLTNGPLDVSKPVHLAGGATQIAGGVRGILLATLPELETQWAREFDGPLWSVPTGVDKDGLAVAVAESGNWNAHMLERSSGDTTASWIPDPQPAEFGTLGPHITATPGGLLATPSPTDVAMFGVDGSDLGAEFGVENGVITELVTASDGELVYVSFGDAYRATDATCATDSDFCAQAVEPGRGVSWVTGLSEQNAGIHRSAPTDDGGAYVSATLITNGAGFELLRITPQGVVSDMAEHGEWAPDDSGDQVMALSPDNKGGVVACGGSEFPIDEDSSPSPFVMAFDPELNLGWELRDFVDATDGAYALACAVTDEAVYVYGLRDMEVGFLNDEPVAVGSAWLARVSF